MGVTPFMSALCSCKKWSISGQIHIEKIMCILTHSNWKRVLNKIERQGIRHLCEELSDYSSETWPIKVECEIRMNQTEMSINTLCLGKSDPLHNVRQKCQIWMYPDKIKCTCFWMCVSVKELPNLMVKYYLIVELLIFKYQWQNVSVSNTV